MSRVERRDQEHTDKYRYAEVVPEGRGYANPLSRPISIVRFLFVRLYTKPSFRNNASPKHSPHRRDLARLSYPREQIDGMGAGK